jgi:hypothetical protein
MAKPVWSYRRRLAEGIQGERLQRREVPPAREPSGRGSCSRAGTFSRRRLRLIAEEIKCPARLRMMRLACESRAIVQATTLGVLCACVAISGCDDDRFAKEKKFLKLPLAEQHERFRSFSPDLQIPIYLAAQSREPPDTAFCRDIAESSGLAAVPVVVRALAAEQDIYPKVDLLRALKCISDVHPVACNAGTLNAAKAAAATIKHERPRQLADALVNGLRCSESAVERPRGRP